MNKFRISVHYIGVTNTKWPKEQNYPGCNSVWERARYSLRIKTQGFTDIFITVRHILDILLVVYNKTCEKYQNDGNIVNNN